jgi:hypothetical protein
MINKGEGLALQTFYCRANEQKSAIEFTDGCLTPLIKVDPIDFHTARVDVLIQTLCTTPARNEQSQSIPAAFRRMSSLTRIHPQQC